ncbi:MAG: hypothetical protein ACXWJM_11575 [Ramlibacter sp.]
MWAELGRRLVPIIAGPVTRLEGIKAVLVIHYVPLRAACTPKHRKHAVAEQQFMRSALVYVSETNRRYDWKPEYGQPLTR